MTIIMTLGWIGAVTYLYSFYCVSRGKLMADSLRYQGLCLISGSLSLVTCAATGAWPSVFTNLIFVGIACYIVLTVKRRYLFEVLRRRCTPSGRKTAACTSPETENSECTTATTIITAD
ncbi:hypothetical protein ACLHIL_07795 [Trueperella sp. LYQ143]